MLSNKQQSPFYTCPMLYPDWTSLLGKSTVQVKCRSGRGRKHASGTTAANTRKIRDTIKAERTWTYLSTISGSSGRFHWAGPESCSSPYETKNVTYEFVLSRLKTIRNIFALKSMARMHTPVPACCVPVEELVVARRSDLLRTHSCSQ